MSALATCVCLLFRMAGNNIFQLIVIQVDMKVVTTILYILIKEKYLFLFFQGISSDTRSVGGRYVKCLYGQEPTSLHINIFFTNRFLILEQRGQHEKMCLGGKRKNQ